MGISLLVYGRFAWVCGSVAECVGTRRMVKIQGDWWWWGRGGMVVGGSGVCAGWEIWSKRGATPVLWETRVAEDRSCWKSARLNRARHELTSAQCRERGTGISCKSWFRTKGPLIRRSFLLRRYLRSSDLLNVPPCDRWNDTFSVLWHTGRQPRHAKGQTKRHSRWVTDVSPPRCPCSERVSRYAFRMPLLGAGVKGNPHFASICGCPWPPKPPFRSLWPPHRGSGFQRRVLRVRRSWTRSNSARVSSRTSRTGSSGGCARTGAASPRAFRAMDR